MDAVSTSYPLTSGQVDPKSRQGCDEENEETDEGITAYEETKNILGNDLV